MLLVAGGQLDHNIGALLRCILQRRVKFVDILVGPNLVPDVTYDIQTGILKLNGSTIEPTASFVRHDVFLQQRGGHPAATAAALNWFYLLKGWELSKPEIAAMNRQSHARENNKIQNLVLARGFGLIIAPTYVSNEFGSFEQRHPENLIQKPVAGGEYTTAYQDFVATLPDADRIVRYPRFVQKKLSRPEMRIYRVGPKHFAFLLESDDVDYRENQRVSIKPTEAPADILERLDKLCDEIGLDFAAADFMQDNEIGEWCFLEVNSQPMFAAFDAVVHGALCNAIVDWLVDPGV